MSSEAPKPRTLVLCFDGTSNQYSNSNTNVVKFYSLLKRDSTEEQLCYYQAGIGTYFSPGVVSPFFTSVAKLLDDAVAWYLNAHVQDGYKFLMNNYCVGDKICLFGFSRGAYTARALAGMLYKVGLLPKDNDEQVNFAYTLYTRTDEVGIAMSAGFKQTFSRNVKIEFIGVWDTVASVGLIMGRSLPFVDSNSAIKTFRHALSLDEHRAKFRPNGYHRPTAEKSAHDPEHANSPTAPAESSPKKEARNLLTSGSGVRGVSQHDRSLGVETLENDICLETSVWDEEQPTDVLEVWFAGCHADIGGSADPDNTRYSLSHISLSWMVREVVASQCGILFDTAALVRNSISLFTFPGSNPPQDGDGSANLDQDALQPIHDELQLNRRWWLLELLPLHYSYQDAQGVWRTTYGFNLGKGRVIVDPQPKFHSSVNDRRNDPALQYTPKAIWNPGTEVYVQ